MKDTSNNTLRSQFLDYVAERLPEEDCARFEERLLADQEFSDLVAALEVQLLDEQASGTLTGEEAAIVKKWTDGSAERRTSAAISSVLVSWQFDGAIPQRRKSNRNAVIMLLVAASVAIAASLFFWHLQRPALPLRTASSSPPPAHVAALAGAATESTDTILLVTQRLRGSDAAPVVYHLHHDVPIRLQLLMPESSPDSTYTLRISKTGDEKFNLQRQNIAATSVGGLRYVEVLLPGNALPPARYTAVLIGRSGNLATPFAVQWK